jgi:hypothetical protein
MRSLFEVGHSRDLSAAALEWNNTVSNEQAN